MLAQQMIRQIVNKGSSGKIYTKSTSSVKVTYQNNIAKDESLAQIVHINHGTVPTPSVQDFSLIARGLTLQMYLDQTHQKFNQDKSPEESESIQLHMRDYLVNQVKQMAL